MKRTIDNNFIKINLRIKPFEQFNEELKNKNPSIQLVGEYKGTHYKTTFMCSLGHTWDTVPRDILKGHKCPYCSGQKVLTGFNDIATLYPDLIPYFKNKEDAYNYSPGSAKRVTIQCPVCHEFEKDMLIHNFIRFGFKCYKCDNSNMSFLNKVLIEILKYIKCEEKSTEYYLDGYSYDGYIKIEGIPYFIEMDGTYHDPKLLTPLGILCKNHDRIKNKLALEKNFILIRIPAYHCTIKEVKEGFYNSRLKNIINLEDIDWEKCASEAHRYIATIVADYYKEHPNSTRKQMSEALGYSIYTIDKALTKAIELGITDYKKLSTKETRKTYCYDEKCNLIGVFSSTRECGRYLRDNNISLISDRQISYRKKNNFRQAVHPKTLTHKGFIFTSKPLSDEERGEILKNGG